MSDVAIAPLEYYASIGASLFPMRSGSKIPVGIVASWKSDHSADPAVWRRWAAANPGCNFGLVASASRLVIVDVDVSEVGRERAWQLWTQWCADNNFPVPPVSCQSARGGWHYYLRLPDGVDPATLAQRALIGPQPGFKKAVVDTRVEGFTVAAGSYYDGTERGEQSGHYILATDQLPVLAPPALIEHLKRSVTPSSSVSSLGTRELGDVAALVTWLNERDVFAEYDAWVSMGMCLKVEFGDEGYDLWASCTWPDALAGAPAKWASFATNADGNSVTLSSWLQRANSLGWRGTVRKSTSAMFGTVASIAAAAGASLPGSSQPMPMVAGQTVLCDIGAPLLAEFLAATGDVPTRPAALDFPHLPETIAGHGLYAPLQDVVARVVAMAEQPKGFRGSRIVQAAALLSLVHAETADAIGRRAEAAGCTWPWRKIKLAAAGIAERVEREFVDQGDWHYDQKGQIEADNSDNVAVFLGILGISVRWNAWLERAEINGWQWAEWTAVDDAAVAILRTRANRTKTRFRAGKDFFWDSLLALAHANPVDPALERLDTLSGEWDGTPRLSVWLARACGTPCDLYHQAVARNIVGGMVRRIREPGCKHDTMPVFFGYQGSGKSTAGAIFADMGRSSLIEIIRGQGSGFTDTIQLGDESKELVLSLAGKCVAEIGEMGMRNGASANHVKAMISRQVDRGRTAYARTVAERPRRNIFWGTTNEDEPLSDPTGNRRFLPIRIDRDFDFEWLHANVGQIIGEAAARHSRGDDFLIPKTAMAAAVEHQEAARSISEIETQLHDWFGETSFTTDAMVTAADLDRACRNAGIRHAQATKSAIMKGLGFAQNTRYISGKKTRVWLRGNGAVRYAVGSDVHGEVRVTIGAA